jgi:hypothetical protein
MLAYWGLWGLAIALAFAYWVLGELRGFPANHSRWFFRLFAFMLVFTAAGFAYVWITDPRLGSPPQALSFLPPVVLVGLETALVVSLHETHETTRNDS